MNGRLVIVVERGRPVEVQVCAEDEQRSAEFREWMAGQPVLVRIASAALADTVPCCYVLLPIEGRPSFEVLAEEPGERRRLIEWINAHDGYAAIIEQAARAGARGLQLDEEDNG
ncbi:MAG: hypothetical protein U0R69_10040 [Gaiellales bacterium]